MQSFRCSVLGDVASSPPSFRNDSQSFQHASTAGIIVVYLCLSLASISMSENKNVDLVVRVVTLHFAYSAVPEVPQYGPRNLKFSIVSQYRVLQSEQENPRAESKSELSFPFLSSKSQNYRPHRSPSNKPRSTKTCNQAFGGHNHGTTSSRKFKDRPFHIQSTKHQMIPPPPPPTSKSVDPRQTRSPIHVPDLHINEEPNPSSNHSPLQTKPTSCSSQTNIQVSFM